MVDLASRFASLNTPVPGTYAAVAVDGDSPHQVGRTHDSHPVLLLRTQAPGSVQRAPVQLRHLAVQFDSPCRVDDGSGRLVDATYTIVTCTADEPDLQTYFLRVAPVILSSLAPDATDRQVKVVVDRFVELFRSLGRRRPAEAQGLWAELYLISISSNPALMVSAWHQCPEERFDFVFGDQRLEVKSVRGPSRVHQFSLEQLDPPAAADLVVASLMLQAAGGGVPASVLVDAIRTALRSQPEPLLYFETCLFEACQDADGALLDVAFDVEHARDTLRYYASTNIPRVELPLPAGVTRVTFCADLGGVEPLVTEHLQQQRGSLFAALG